MHLDTLIVDLAIILSIAAVTTILFKWLKLPVVLGYIVAGYLASNHFSMLPTVSSSSDITTWAEIGVIFLLFRLGLDFSFKKLINVGGASLVAALVIMVGMMIVGFATGKLLLWSTTDSVFLGGMLSMSSTTIIYKQLSDTGQLQRRFAGVVFGILVVEDLFAIIMLVLLSTIYVGKSFSGVELGWNVIKLMFFLVVWFGVGIYIIPTLLKKMKRLLTDETLLIISLGLCFAMVFFASYAGFSPALGAFIMGSILAETAAAHKIESQTKPVSDLFGAIFFVSVGMLVNPDIIADYWPIILLLIVIVVVCAITFATFGVLLSGRPLRQAVKSGFALPQIGEFSYIIATLGVTLGVTSDFLYPVIVSVSVATIFLTPFLMKGAEPTLKWLEGHLPQSVITVLDRYSSGSVTVSVQSDWRMLLNAYLKRVALFSLLLSGLTWLLTSFCTPFIKFHLAGFLGDAAATVFSLFVISPFVWALAIHRIKPEIFIKLWTNSHFNRGFMISLIMLRVAIALGFIMAVLVGIHSYRWGTIVGLSFVLIVVLIFSKRIARGWRHFEVQFRRNIDGADKDSPNANSDRNSSLDSAHDIK